MQHKNQMNGCVTGLKTLCWINCETANNWYKPEVVFMARLNVAGSSIRTWETNAGIDGYFTVLTLGERKGQGKSKELIIEYWLFS